MWYLGIVDGEHGNWFEAIEEANCIYDLLEPLALKIIKKKEELPDENLTYTISDHYDYYRKEKQNEQKTGTKIIETT